MPSPLIFSIFAFVLRGLAALSFVPAVLQLSSPAREFVNWANGTITWPSAMPGAHQFQVARDLLIALMFISLPIVLWLLGELSAFVARRMSDATPARTEWVAPID